MLVVSENLRGIAQSLNLCQPQFVEEFSISICLDRQVRRMHLQPKAGTQITYGTPYDEDEIFAAPESLRTDLKLMPGENVLGCSSESYKMPLGYLGLVQTKGSLARLFVSATCNDGQIEPGFEGRITLELTNHASVPIMIPVGAPVAQMFILRCSTEVERPYNGRYQHATGPTLAVFK